MTEIVSLTNIRKEFGELTAVDGLNFSLKEGELFSLIGPSGCGKTTTLRMVAGFEYPTTGEVSIQNENNTDRPPYERDTGMVFQGYALFPHKTVGENVGFGLKMNGVAKEKREDKIAEMLELVDLPGTEDRTPGELSGGQQQRVALARALIVEPSVLLLDEPLASLDAKLRKQMRSELKRIQSETGVTTLYVTHNQEEALAMSDRIAVMNNGHVEQIGTPANIYENPVNSFVADFIGESNLTPGRVDEINEDRMKIHLTNIDTGPVHALNHSTAQISTGENVLINVRPEDISVSATELEMENVMQVELIDKTYLGNKTQLIFAVDEIEFQAEVHRSQIEELSGSNNRVYIGWSARDTKPVKMKNER